MNPLLLAMRRLSVAGTTPLWSVLYAGATAADSIVHSGPVVMDMTQTPDYASVEFVSAAVVVDPTKNTELRAKSITGTSGYYRAGTVAAPFPRTFTHRITVSGTRSGDPQVSAPAGPTILSANRGFMAMPGFELSLVATVPTVNIWKLGATAAAGATTITADRNVTLKAGEEIEIGSTQYWAENSAHARERRTVAADVTNSTTITLTVGLTYRHYGQLQYLVPPSLETVAGTNLRTTPYTIQASDTFGTVSGTTITGTKVLAVLNARSTGLSQFVVDNRATCGLLTHPIKFGAPNDTDWTTHGFGAHMMTMGKSSKTMLQGVQFERVGQAGFVGRYPYHDHMRSYTPYPATGSGTALGDIDATVNFLRYCSIANSSNRGFTIHGTCGGSYIGNVVSNTDTHGIFLEDGSERRNVIDGNFVSGINLIGYGKTAIKLHDTVITGNLLGTSGPAGIWFTSPDNYLRNNIVSGAFIGIWNSFAWPDPSQAAFSSTNQNSAGKGCFGASRDVAFNPGFTLPLQHFNNEAGCCKFLGMMTGGFVMAEDGTVGDGTGGAFGIQYAHRADPSDLNNELFQQVSLWKCPNWYGNQAFRPHYLNWTCSGYSSGGSSIYGRTSDTTGGGTPATFDAGWFFARTLDDPYSSGRGNMMVSYHNGLNRPNCGFVSAPWGNIGPPGSNGTGGVSQQGGAIDLDDFYNNPIELGFLRDTNSVFLGANVGVPGLAFPPTFLLPQFGSSYQSVYEQSGYTVAALLPWSKGLAIKALPADGSMFGRGGWWLFDDPFYTYGTTGAVAAGADSSGLGAGLNGKIVSADQRYIGCFADHTPAGDLATKPINYTRYAADNTTVVGTWNTGAGPTNHNYENMRHCCMRTNGVGFYDISWSRTDVALPTGLNLKLTGMTNSGDHVVIRADWSGSTSPGTPRLTTYMGGTPDVNYHDFTTAANLTALFAATTCKVFVDGSNNKIYFHIWGGDLSRLVGPSGAQNDQENYSPKYLNVNT